MKKTNMNARDSTMDARKTGQYDLTPRIVPAGNHKGAVRNLYTISVRHYISSVSFGKQKQPNMKKTNMGAGDSTMDARKTGQYDPTPRIVPAGNHKGAWKHSRLHISNLISQWYNLKTFASVVVPCRTLDTVQGDEEEIQTDSTVEDEKSRPEEEDAVMCINSDYRKHHTISTKLKIFINAVFYTVEIA
ncbi:hypothetical protein CHS0354_014170 [Potamilus streckersoni]|uniref:Uncharacterized protein n=1 Tax=Potamilus streckersoni TaxID=2493646 RepID=A0AAE0SMN9_9BIVA|nr:hypothetical protein CHS0354_014170 [Potamilus streckersoni]